MENLPMIIPSLATGGLAGLLAGAGRRALGYGIGAYAANWAQEAGSIYGDIYQRTGQTRPGVAAGYGAVAAGFDTAAEMIPVARLGKVFRAGDIKAGAGALGMGLAREINDRLVARVGKAAATQFFLEGGTEAIQTAIEEAAVSHADPTQPFWTSETIDRIIDGGLKGAVSGAALGGISGIPRPPQRAPAAVQEAPAAIGETVETTEEEETPLLTVEELTRGAAAAPGITTVTTTAEVPAAGGVAGTIAAVTAPTAADQDAVNQAISGGAIPPTAPTAGTTAALTTDPQSAGTVVAANLEAAGAPASAAVVRETTTTPATTEVTSAPQIAQSNRLLGSPSPQTVQEVAQEVRGPETPAAARPGEQALAAQPVTIQPPPGLRLTGNQFLAKTFGLARKLAIAWAFSNLPRQVINRQRGWAINISRAGIDKALSGPRDHPQEHMEAIRAVPALLENADLVESRPDRKKDPNIRAIHIFSSPIIINDQLFAAKLTIKETRDDKWWYDHSLTKLERPAGTSLDVSRTAATASAPQGPQTGPLQAQTAPAQIAAQAESDWARAKREAREAIARSSRLGAAADPAEMVASTLNLYRALFNLAKAAIREGARNLAEFLRRKNLPDSPSTRYAWEQAVAGAAEPTDPTQVPDDILIDARAVSTKEAPGAIEGEIQETGTSQSVYASAPYLKQQEDRRQALANQHIDQKHGGDLFAAAADLNSVEPESLRRVTAAQIQKRANAATRTASPDEALRLRNLMLRLNSETTYGKTIAGQNLQAEQQVNKILGTMRLVLAYLDNLRKKQAKHIGTKLPADISNQTQDLMTQAGQTAAENLPSDATIARLLAKARQALTTDWSDLFQLSRTTQVDRQRELFDRVRADRRFATLTVAEQAELSQALFRAWERARNNIFRQEFARLVDLPTVTKVTQARLSRALPRLIRYLNLGLLDQPAFLEAVAKQFGVPTINQATLNKLQDLAEKAQAAPEGIRRNKIQQQMLDLLHSDPDIDPYDLIRDVWYANVLSSMRTFIDVLTGSWLTGFTMAARASANVLVGGQAPAGQRALIAGRIMSAFIGAAGDGIAGAIDIIRTGDTTRLPDAQERLVKELGGLDKPLTLETLKRTGKGWKKAAGQLSYVRRIMLGLDYVGASGTRKAMILYAAATRDDGKALNEAMKSFDAGERSKAMAQARAEMGPKAKPIDIRARADEILEAGVSDEIHASANEMATLAALNIEPVGWGGHIYRMLGSQQNFLTFFARSVFGLSFARAAINMVQQHSDWMPGLGALNYARTAITQTPWFKNLPDNSPLRAMGLDVSPERRAMILSAQIAGLGLTLAGMAIFLMDDSEDRDTEITGSWAGLTPTEKNQLRARGERPLSIRIGNTWISFKNTPFAAALAIIGSARDRQRFRAEKWKEANLVEHTVNTWLMGLAYVRDLSPLTAFSNALGLSSYRSGETDYTSTGRWLADTLGNWTTSMIPLSSMLKDIDAWMDPRLYRPNAGFDYWLRNMPFARRYANSGPAINALGEEVVVSRAPLSRWLSQENRSPLWDALADKAAKGVFIPVPEKGAPVIDRTSHQRRQMTGPEHYNYTLRAGRLWKQTIERNLPAFQRMSPAQAETWINRLRERIHKQARIGLQTAREAD
jgi:hypothetical protein